MNIGLLFDMDGVIVNNHEYHYQSWQLMCEKYGKPLSQDSYMQNMNGRTLNEVVQFIFETEMSMERVREIGEEKEAIYRDLYRKHLAPTDGLLTFLAACSAASIPMVVGTSAPTRNVDFTLDGLGIRSIFQGVLDERAVTKGKPNPEIYQKCAASIGLPNQQCVVFEDALSGIEAGKAAGSKVIALATSHKRSELDADLIIDDFTQLGLEQIHELFST
ncbi:MAG: HAD family phosphatase [Cytophagales bacterium]|nr:HAD family phosphatase [Cytophagales bacterium]